MDAGPGPDADAGTPPGQCETDGWVLQELEPTRGTHFFFPIVHLSDADAVHILYDGSFAGVLMAHADGAGFTHTQVVDDDPQDPNSPDVLTPSAVGFGFDGAGDVRAVYGLSYFADGFGSGETRGFGNARFVADAWQLDAALEAEVIPWAMALDSADRTMVLASEGGEILRLYLRAEGGSWSEESVFEPDGPLAFPRGDMAIDGEDTLHVVYTDTTTSGLLYRTRTAAGVWSAPATVEAAPLLDLGAFALGPAGQLAVLYQDRDADGWTIASRADGDWAYEALVVPGAYDGTLQSAAFDGAGRLHLLLEHWTGEEAQLLYTTHAAGEALEWEVVEAGSSYGLNRSLALDALAQPHIAYTRGTSASDDLVYGHRPCR